jgi:hypothetical protein
MSTSASNASIVGSAPISTGVDLGYQLLGAGFGESGGGKRSAPTGGEQGSELSSRSQRGVSSAAAESIRSHDHGNGLTVPSDRHLVAGEDAVE